MAHHDATAAPSTKPPSKKKKRSKRNRRRARIAASLVPLGFIGAFFTNQGVESFVCESAVVAPATAVTSRICDEQFQRVDTTEANLWMARYVGRSGGQVVGGWKLLSPETREEVTYEQWSSGWKSVDFAERVGDVTRVPGQFNTFTATYRTYQRPSNPRKPGLVQTWQGNFEIRRKPGNDAELTPRDRVVRVAQERPVFPVVHTITETRSLDSPVNGPSAMDPVRKDATLAVYCAVELSQSDDWWVRTDVGFIDSNDLDVPEGDLPDLLGCDAHYAIVS